MVKVASRRLGRKVKHVRISKASLKVGRDHHLYFSLQEHKEMERDFVKIHQHTPFLWADSILLLQGKNKDIMIELIEGSEDLSLTDRSNRVPNGDSAIPLILPTRAPINRAIHKPDNLKSDIDYFNCFTDYQLIALILVLRCFVPQSTNHNPDEESGFVWAHIERLEHQGKGRTLRKLLPELFPNGAGCDKHLFGCPDCDIILQILRALAFLECNVDHHQLRTSAEFCTPERLEATINGLIKNRISVPEMYRLIANYRPSSQQATYATNQRYTFDLLMASMDESGITLKTYVHGIIRREPSPSRWGNVRMIIAIIGVCFISLSLTQTEVLIAGVGYASSL